MKRTLLILSGLLAVFALSANAAQTADVIFVVDESGSMSGEHAWLGDMVYDLDAGLISAGVTNNRYGLVGFGSVGHDPLPTPPNLQAPHSHLVGATTWGNATQLDAATSGLALDGGTEDGWAAISYALSSYSFRSDAALNIVLITDEDRDITAAYGGNYNAILSELTGRNAKLNVVVNATFGNSGLGIFENSGNDSTYIAAAAGGFNKIAGSSVLSAFGTTNNDYINLAIGTEGAAWDLNRLRAGGLTATSFSNAFVDLKVAEIVEQEPTVPEPGTIALLGLGLLSLVYFKRRRA